MAISLDVADIKPLLGTFGLGQAPSSKLPDVSNLPARPMPLPPKPTPAQAGFSAYAADPLNQQRVMNSITPPGQPIIPETTAAPTPPPMAAVTPPSAPPSNNALVPPPAIANAAPTAAPIPTLAEWEAANPKSVEKPVLAGRSKGMNIFQGITAGLTGAAGGIKGNPMAGVDYVNQMRQNDQGVDARNQAKYQGAVIQPLQDAAKLADTQSQTAYRTAQAGKADAQAGAIGDPTVLRTRQIADAAKRGQVPVYDDSGNLTSFADDTKSAVYKSRVLKDQLVQAQVDATKSQKELRDAEAAFNKAKADPNSPLFKQTQQRLAIAQQNASAANTRATAYMGNYMQHAYNVGLNGETLAGAPIISDDNGNQAVVGSTNASNAIKSQAGAAQFNDVHGALDSLEGTAKALVQSGGTLNSAAVIAALATPHTSVQEWLQSVDKAHLTREERAYVQSNIALHENIQGMRKSAGGGATDSQVANLLKMAPGQSTPDLDYLMGQTNQIRSTAERLGKGATVASGGLTVRGQGNALTPPAQNKPAPNKPAKNKPATATEPKVDGHWDAVAKKVVYY
ncbi:MAG: hypothetical protein JWQ49_126 [Edaphobacter sp.]|nr:hypothetical protein [Edaphobacter sp.]